MLRHFIWIACIWLIGCTSRSSPTIVAPVPPTSTPIGMDVELDAALQQAHDSLDEFINMIATPHVDRTFVAVKVRFLSPDGSSQDIWIDAVTYADGVFRGSMGDDIPALKLQAGEKIMIHQEDILDWMIVQDGKLIGGYTIRLAVQRMSPEERERFLSTLDYEIED